MVSLWRIMDMGMGTCWATTFKSLFQLQLCGLKLSGDLNYYFRWLDYRIYYLMKKILVANLITTLFLDLRSLIIGKMYSANMLAYFNKGKMFPSVIITNINGSIQSVMLPTYSSQQDNKRRVKAMVRRSIKTSTFIVFPMMIGLAIVAEPLVKVILTEKWQSSVPFLQIFCFTYMLMPIHTANLEAIKALGYSNSILKIEIVKKVLEFITLVISLNYGVYAIAIGTFITSIISLVINSYLT